MITTAILIIACKLLFAVTVQRMLLAQFVHMLVTPTEHLLLASSRRKNTLPRVAELSASLLQNSAT